MVTLNIENRVEIYGLRIAAKIASLMALAGTPVFVTTKIARMLVIARIDCAGKRAWKWMGNAPIKAEFEAGSLGSEAVKSVTLNGSPVLDCYAADRSLGFVEVPYRTKDGRLKLNWRRDSARTKRLYGKVEVIFHGPA